MIELTTQNTVLYLALVIAGLYISSQEWINIWSKGFATGCGRLFMLNLPLFILMSIILNK